MADPISIIGLTASLATISGLVVNGSKIACELGLRYKDLAKDLQKLQDSYDLWTLLSHGLESTVLISRSFCSTPAVLWAVNASRVNK